MRYFHIMVAAVAGMTSAPALAQDKPITITFMARPADDSDLTFGHAFFCIAVPLQTGSKEDCFGFYAKDMIKVFDGPGLIASDLKPENMAGVTTSLKHRISEQTRQNVYATIRRWAGSDYKLLVNNCGDFLYDVAKTAGLAVPDRSSVTFPVAYVNGLKQLHWAGNWASTDAGSRFSVNIKDGQAEWTERSTSGAAFTRTVPVLVEGDSAKIERPNSGDVLTFLGFQPSLRAQILAAGPRPSYMTLSRLDGVMNASWYGLLAIKNDDATLKELKQPGSMPPKLYSMTRKP